MTMTITKRKRSTQKPKLSDRQRAILDALLESAGELEWEQRTNTHDDESITVERVTRVNVCLLRFSYGTTGLFCLDVWGPGGEHVIELASDRPGRDNIFILLATIRSKIVKRENVRDD